MNYFHIIMLLFLSNFYIGINSKFLETEKKNEESGLKIAFCLTGQLARLELRSKIYRIFIPNAKYGNIPHVFVYLDGDTDDIGQTYWKYDYTNNPYKNYDRQGLKAYIDRITEREGYNPTIRTRVKIESPPRHIFAVVGNKIPVSEKVYTGHDGPKDNYEPADTRFQNNMRWMAGLRECMKWVMLTEYQQKWFYDIVVRLRDDTYALGPWVITPSYFGALTSSSNGNFRGINDHNFAVDRRWGESFMRGLVEDYYFNETLQHKYWGNAEGRIRMVARSYNIPLQYADICLQPLIPLRGLYNETHWRLHPLYVRHVKEDCQKDIGQLNGIRAVPRELREDDNSITNARFLRQSQDAYGDLRGCCNAQWSHMLKAQAVPLAVHSETD